MSIDEAIAKIDSVVTQIDTGMAAISEEIATNAIALIINRIQQKGLDGKQYSNNPLPAFYFEDRALNAGGRNLLAKEDKRLLRKKIKTSFGEFDVTLKKSKGDDSDGISYKQWREANGLQVDHVDLTYSGRMFQNVGVIGTVRRGDNFVTIIGGFDKEVKDKLRWNAQRYGDFFLATPEEKEKLSLIYKNRVATLFKKAGL